MPVGREQPRWPVACVAVAPDAHDRFSLDETVSLEHGWAAAICCDWTPRCRPEKQGHQRLALHS